MKDAEFFYWLQGYFELSGHAEPLTADQVVIIQRHIDLVLASDRLGQANPRIHEIRGILSVHAADPGAVTAAIDAVTSEFERVTDGRQGDLSGQLWVWPENRKIC